MDQRAGEMMRSEQLEPWQLQRIRDTVHRQLVFYQRLTGRMFQTHFPRHDKLQQLAGEAQTAIDRLHDELVRLQSVR